MTEKKILIDKIFHAQNSNGCWKMLAPSDAHYPAYLHYMPTFRATLWTLLLLADIEIERDDPRIVTPLSVIKAHFYDPALHIYSLGKDHFPVPCLNGNIIYLDSYFNNGSLSRMSLDALEFFSHYQRFDDGVYSMPRHTYCSNKSCYGKHSCYWGIVKLLKGISFVSCEERTEAMRALLEKCIDFILLHHVCFRSHSLDQIMINKIDQLTFPNMYRSDFLEILWLLKREQVKSDSFTQALKLLHSKRLVNGSWPLERKIHNLIISLGEAGEANSFITKRASEVVEYYSS